MTFLGKEPGSSKIVMDGKCIEQINAFMYLGTKISNLGEVDIYEKMVQFLRISGLSDRILPPNRVRREAQLKVYQTLAMPMLIYGMDARSGLEEKR